MIWNNKGHEFDSAYEAWKERYDNTPIWLFGAGNIGRKVLGVVSGVTTIHGFIDNDEAKQGTSIFGYQVISWDEYKKLNDGCLVVVCASKSNIPIINHMIDVENVASINYKDYLRYFRIRYLYDNKQLYIPIVQMSVTERCTLKCKKCAHACNHVPSASEDISFNDLKIGLKDYFSLVDRTGEFYLIGGEPLLSKHLTDLIWFINDNYRNRVDILSITTNGTVLPDESLLKASRNCGVLIRISNYVSAIPRLRQQIKKLETLLEEWNIKYILQSESNSWMDYGFDHVDHEMDEYILRRVFDNCSTPCRELRGSRFYYCIQARACSENMGLGIGKKDYLDLTELGGEAGKRILLEYDSGYSERGYLEMCNHCYGADSVKHPIPAAEQDG